MMRREFGTVELPPSEVTLGRGRANGPVHVHYFPPWARLKKASEAVSPSSFRGHVKVLELAKNSRNTRQTFSHGYALCERDVAARIRLVALLGLAELLGFFGSITKGDYYFTGILRQMQTS